MSEAWKKDTSACRVGERIRFVRKLKGVTLTELGKRVGLGPDRIQKYENGFRKPKDDLLEKIATALGVSVYALADPVLTDEVGVMYALFELEKRYKLSLTQIDGINYLAFAGDDSYKINEFLTYWHTVKLLNKSRLIQSKTSSESASDVEDDLKLEYYDWEWNFPNDLTIEDIARKSSIDKKQKVIEELENLLSKMKEELKREMEP